MSQRTRGGPKWGPVCKETQQLLKKKDYQKAFRNAQTLLQIDDSKILGYIYFIKAAIGMEDLNAALMGCYEGLEKEPDNETLIELLTEARKQKRLKDEAPILENEKLPARMATIEVNDANDSICVLQFLKDDNYFLFVSEEGEIRIVSRKEEEGKCVVFRKDLKIMVSIGELSPDGNTLVLGTHKGSIVLVTDLVKSPTNPTVLPPVQVGEKHDWMECVTWMSDPTKSQSTLACAFSRTIALYNIEEVGKATLIQSFENHDATIQGLIWDKVRNRLTSISNKQTLLWDFSKGIPQEPTELPFDSIVHSFHSTTCQKRDLISVGSRDGDCLIWDVENTELNRPLSLVRSDDSQNEAITSVCFASRGNKYWLASANSLGIIESYKINQDVTSSVSNGLHKAHRAAIGAMKSHPTYSHWIASAGNDGVIYVWDLSVRAQPRLALLRLITKDTPAPPLLDQPLPNYKDVSNWIRKLEWNTKGDLLLAGFCGGKVALWKN